MKTYPNDVRSHYDQLSTLYGRLWGEHIHHGFWEGAESQAEAQVNLTRRLAEQAGIPKGARVLDVGCGLGGSSIWLAQELDCSVRGITISPTQKGIAEKRARRAGVSDQVEFEVVDANELSFDPGSFDAIWIIECSEHLVDKADFLRRCGNIVRPGGSLAICAWLKAEDGSPSSNLELVEEVCEGMLCPSLGSMSDYTHWMESAGFEQVIGNDITRQVEKTWEICECIIRRPWLRAMLAFMPNHTRRFAKSFAAIRRAYAEDAMAYGMITAAKGNVTG